VLKFHRRRRISLGREEDITAILNVLLSPVAVVKPTGD